MYRRSFLFGAFTVFLFFLFVILVAIVNPLKTRAGMYAFYALEALLLTGVIYFARVYFGYESYTVTVEANGLRFGAKETAPVVPWSDIRKLKMGRNIKRINVLGVDNKILGTIKLQLEGIDRLIHTILNAMPQTGTISASNGGIRRFKGSLTTFVVWGLFEAGSAAFAIFHWSTADPKKYLGLVVFLVLLFLGPLFAKTEIRVLEFIDNHLAIKTLMSRKSYTRNDISSVELFVPTPKTHGRSMDVALHLHGREVLEICPSNQNPFEIFWTCRRFLGRPDEIRVFEPQEEE
jgi:hypothetical protein